MKNLLPVRQMWMLALVLLLAGAPAAFSAPDLQIVQKSPSGPAEDYARITEITVTFNQPMVNLTSNGEMGADCPLQVEPPLKGRCRWRGTNTLVYELAEKIAPSRTYRVRIPAGTASRVSGQRLAGDVEWSFESQRLQLTRSLPDRGECWVVLDAHVYLQFNLPMDPSRAKGSILLEERPLGADKHVVVVPMTLRKAIDEEVGLANMKVYSDGQYQALRDRVLVGVPSRKLKPDHTYRVVCKKGLLAAEGSLGLPEERTLDFETWYTFRVSGHVETMGCMGSWGGNDIWFTFSNPLADEDVAKAAVITPAPEGLDPGTTAVRSGVRRPLKKLAMRRGGWTSSQTAGSLFSQSVESYRHVASMKLSGARLKPDTLYTVVIPAGLKDKFGNTLPEAVTFTVHSGDYCSSLNPLGGLGILESYLPLRHPVGGMNFESASLLTAWVKEEDLPIFYRARRGWGDDLPDYHKLLQGAKKSRWKPHAFKKNVTFRSFVQLDKAAGGRNGGFRYLEMEGPWALDDITPLGLTLKVSSESILLWVTHLDSAKSMAGVPVRLRDHDGKVFWSGKTDGDGLAVAPGMDDLHPGKGREDSLRDIWAFAEHPEGTAVICSSWRGGEESWRYGFGEGYCATKESRVRGLLFADRGVYRPGETVHLKGVVRWVLKSDWRYYNADDELEVTVTDSRDQKILATHTVLDPFGAFHLDVPLEEGAPTGVWEVVVRSSKGRVYLSDRFDVESFKMATFEVKAHSAKDSYRSGEDFHALVEGRYLMGAPMAGCDGEWTLVYEPTWFVPPHCDGYRFEPYAGPGRRPSGYFGEKVAATGKLQLDGKGLCDLRVPLAPRDLTQPFTASLEVRLISPERQKVFRRTSATVHISDLYIGLKGPESYVQTAKEWKGEALCVSPSGERKDGQRLKLTLFSRESKSVQRAGLNGRTEWQNEDKVTTVKTWTASTKKGVVPIEFTAGNPGSYFLVAEGTDSKGASVASHLDFSITGEGGRSFDERKDDDRVQVTCDKEIYKVGDVAKVLVHSPYERCRALVTIEREGVMRRWFVDLKGSSQAISVPITDAMVPNAYVGVVLVKGRNGQHQLDGQGLDLAKPQAKAGCVELKVDPSTRKIVVDVKTDRSVYRPQDPVTVRVTSRNEKGGAVPAQFVVWVVDEGVLRLTGYQRPDLLEEFYRTRGLGVETRDSRIWIVGERSLGQKGENRGGGGGGMTIDGADLRRRFLPTAYWNPSVVTDKDGNATVVFRLPDNLSKFRVMAVALNERMFGGAETTLRVKQNFLLRPSLPRFARRGDTFRAGVVVQNAGSGAVTGEVRVEVLGGAVSLAGSPRRAVTLTAGQAQEVLWDGSAVAVGEGTFRFAATGRGSDGVEKDGLEWRLPVRRFGHLETVATSSVTGDQAVEGLRLPAGVGTDVGAVRLGLSSSALSGLQQGARYLFEYPYGCLEQRLSRIVPVLVGADLVATFGLGDLGEHKREVKAFFRELPAYQADDGGYCYWNDCKFYPEPYLTAYVLEMAAIAKKAGYEVPEASLQQAQRFMTRALSERQDWGYPYNQYEQYAFQAYGVYVLALWGSEDVSRFSKLYERRDQMPFLAKGHLLKAAVLLKRDKVILDSLADGLLNQAVVNPRSMYFQEPDNRPMYWVHGSNVVATSVCLQALLEAKGGFPGDEKVIRWLTEERKHAGRWGSTHDNAVALRAFQDYYHLYEKDAPDFKAAVRAEAGQGVRDLWNGTFQGRSLGTQNTQWSLRQFFGVPAGPVKLSVSKTGTGRLYYNLVMEYEPTGVPPAANEGFSVERTIRPLTEGGPAGALKAGSRAIVTLKVHTTHERRFVALVDALPGGFEVVNPDFGTEGGEDLRQLGREKAKEAWWGNFNRHEVYDDRVLLFADDLQPGDHTYSYLVQATTPGDFLLPPTWVEEMYEPEIFGRGPTGRLKIVP